MLIKVILLSGYYTILLIINIYNYDMGIIKK